MAEGGEARLIFEGGKSGGNGETDSGTPLEEVKPGDGEALGVNGDEELDCVGEGKMA